MRWQVVAMLGNRLAFCCGCILAAPRIFACWAQTVIGHFVIRGDMVIGGHDSSVYGLHVAFVGLQCPAIIGTGLGNQVTSQFSPATKTQFRPPFPWLHPNHLEPLFFTIASFMNPFLFARMITFLGYCSFVGRVLRRNTMYGRSFVPSAVQHSITVNHVCS